MAHRGVVDVIRRAGGGHDVARVVQRAEPRVELAGTRCHALRADVVVLRPVVAVDVDVRAGVDGVDDGVGALSGPGGVHPHRLAAVALLHRAVAVGVIPIERHVAVVAEGAKAVPGVPQQLALRDLRSGAVVRPCPPCRHVCQIAVGVIGVGMRVVDPVSGGGRSLRAVVRLRHVPQLVMGTRLSAVGVGHVIARVQRHWRHEAVAGDVLLKNPHILIHNLKKIYHS